MWFATDRGVARFDGKRFKIYSRREGLLENTIFTMTEGVDGTLWFCHFNRSLYYLEGDSINEHPYKEKLAGFLDSINGEISTIVGDSNHSIWLGLTQHPFLIKLSSNGAIKSYPPNDGESGSYITHVTSNGAILSGKGSNTTSALSMYSSDDPNIQRVQGLHWLDGVYSELCMGENDQVFVIHTRGVLAIEKGQVTQIKKFSTRPLVVLSRPKIGLWVGLKGKGVQWYEHGNLDGLPQIFLHEESVTDIIKDHEGGFWFTTHNNGVFYAPVIRSMRITEQNGLPNSQVNSLCILNDSVYLGHSSGHLSFFPKNAIDALTYQEGYGYVSLLRPVCNGLLFIGAIRGPETQLKPNFRTGFALDCQSTKDSFWYAAGSAGILSSGSKGHILRTSLEGNNRAEALLRIGPGEFYIGTLNGVIFWKNGEFIDLGKEFPLLSSRVSDIARLSKEWLAVATRGEGVLFWNGKKILKSPQDQNQLSLDCQVLAVDDSSTLWVGTADGIDRIAFDTIAGKVIETNHIGKGHGLASADINDLYLDGRDIWVGTNSGVYRLDKQLAKEKTARPFVFIAHASLSGMVLKDGAQIKHTKNLLEVTLGGITYKDPENLLFEYRLVGADSNWHSTLNNQLTYPSLSPGAYRLEARAIAKSGIGSTGTATLDFTILAPFWEHQFFLPGILLLVVLIFFIVAKMSIAKVKRNERLQREMSQMKDAALRNQMNPHFVYNAMNSIQGLILKGERKQSILYLTKFSGLLRKTFDNSGQDLVRLSKELEALQLYGDLERMRYSGEFDIDYQFPTKTEQEKLFVPPLLIQPFLENAVLHGVLNASEKGKIIVEVVLQDGYIFVNIQDNGTGKRKEKKTRDSTSGMMVTQQRIEQFNKQRGVATHFEMRQEQSGAGKGTQVCFRLACESLF